jgi:dTDP-4-amino-4,6-dideoxygalactose transaminase
MSVVRPKGGLQQPPRSLSLSDPVLGEEETAALKEVIESGWITLGDRVRSFERAFADVHGLAGAVAVSSGTAALHLCLAALGVGPGDEVLVPSLTFVASANAVLYAGATPVLVDIDSVQRPHMSLENARAKLTGNTRAIVLVHYGGWRCPMQAWRAFADEHGLLIVEDAAHSPGLPGVGTHGDATAFSFYGNKNMTTAEGGMAVARDADALALMRGLRSHGMTTLTLDRYAGHAFSYDVTDLGFNYRMDELRAAVGLVQLAKLGERNTRRAALLAHYRSRLAALGNGVSLPFEAGEETVGHLCPALLPERVDREHVMRVLREAGVHSSIHYPPIHRFSYHSARLGPQELPHTEAFAAREISLPLHPKLATEDVDYVVEQLGRALG